MKIIITVTMFLLAGRMALSGTIVSLQNEVPGGKGWKDEGSLPGRLVDEGAKKVLELKDDSESGNNLYAYEISENDAETIRKRGFAFNFRIKVVEHGAHTVTLRIKDEGIATFTFWRDEKTKELQVSTWDYDNAKYASARVNGLNKYVDVKAVWAPGKKLEVSLNGKMAYDLLFMASDRVPRNSVEVGLPDPRRMGVVLLEALSLSTR